MRTFNQLHDDIRSYLDSLTPDLPVHTREEIAVYCVNLFIVREGDILIERDREWKKSIKRSRPDARVIFEDDEEKSNDP